MDLEKRTDGWWKTNIVPDDAPIILLTGVFNYLVVSHWLVSTHVPDEMMQYLSQDISHFLAHPTSLDARCLMVTGRVFFSLCWTYTISRFAHMRTCASINVSGMRVNTNPATYRLPYIYSFSDRQSNACTKKKTRSLGLAKVSGQVFCFCIIKLTCMWYTAQMLRRPCYKTGGACDTTHG